MSSSAAAGGGGALAAAISGFAGASLPPDLRRGLQFLLAACAPGPCKERVLHRNAEWKKKFGSLPLGEEVLSAVGYTVRGDTWVLPPQSDGGAALRACADALRAAVDAHAPISYDAPLAVEVRFLVAGACVSSFDWPPDVYTGAETLASIGLYDAVVGACASLGWGDAGAQPIVYAGHIHAYPGTTLDALNFLRPAQPPKDGASSTIVLECYAGDRHHVLPAAMSPRGVITHCALCRVELPQPHVVRLCLHACICDACFAVTPRCPWCRFPYREPQDNLELAQALRAPGGPSV